VHVSKTPLLSHSSGIEFLGGGRAHDSVKHSNGPGFWHTAWPWVIGGVATLAAGGAVVYVLTRPTADVNVGSASVNLH
jgi:hypothetical protein